MGVGGDAERIMESPLYRPHPQSGRWGRWVGARLGASLRGMGLLTAEHPACSQGKHRLPSQRPPAGGGRLRRRCRETREPEGGEVLNPSSLSPSWNPAAAFLSLCDMGVTTIPT